MSTPAISERLGTALADRYRIERELGQGGMATVYLAEDLKHKRKVALKVLKPELAAVLGAERFVVEITTTAALQHPHILPLFDSGTADGFLYYVMPFIDGETLRGKLNRETQLGVDEAARIAIDVASALHYAHTHGVIHRDIKPGNILLHDGRPMVADFGIALAVSAAAGGRMTETGLSLGTPHYMSPEQATAEKDISAQQIIMKIITEQAALVTAHWKLVPPNVAAAVAQALEKLPADRFESAKAFADALGNSTFATQTSLASEAPPTAGLRHNRPALALGAVALLATATALAGWLRPPPPQEVARYSILLPEGQRLGVSQRSRIAISPDGSILLYTSSDRGRSQLLARRRDALTAEPISGTEGAYNPFFSPDGRKIGFVAGSPRALRMATLAGSPPITLTDSLVDQGGASWGYDGYIYYDGHLEGDGIARVRETGGDPEPVTSADSANRERWHFQPEALPNGRGLLFTISRGVGTTWSIGATSIGSGEHRALIEGRVPRYADGVLFYLTNDGVLMAVPFDEDRLAITGPAVPVAEEVAVRGIRRADLALSATGTLVYTKGESTLLLSELVWVTRDGRVTPVDTAWSRAMSHLAISPDGRRVAFSVSEGGQRDVWVKQLDRGVATRLSFGAILNGWPAWSRDGQSVFFEAQGPLEGNSEVGLMRGPADGSELPVVVRAGFSAGQNQFVITPDGSAVMYSVGGDIFKVAMRADAPVDTLVRGPGTQAAPRISPDGRWMSYASDETGRFELFVRPFPDARRAKQLVSTNDGVARAAWSVDGRELFYQNGSGEFIAARIIPGAAFAIGERRTLFNVEDLWPGGPTAVVPAPDGRFLMLRPSGVGERPDELIVVQNFLTEVRAKLKP